MNSNIELLKKNGELISKYYDKLANEVRRLTDEPVDDEAINRCNSEMLSILNEFAFERDKLYGAVLDQVTAPFVQEASKDVLATDKNYIIHLIDKIHPDCNDSYLTYWDYYVFSYDVSISRGNAFKFTYEEASKIALELKEKIGKDYDIHTEPFETLTAAEKAYNTIMNTESKRKDKSQEFNRTESLTFAETDKEEEWCKKHNDKYHAKSDKKLHKKNPFHGGVSPVGRFATVWQYCSISSWCECVCKDCYEAYRHEKDKLGRLAGDAKNYKKQKKLVEKLYKKAVFTVRDIDE